MQQFRSKNMCVLIVETLKKCRYVCIPYLKLKSIAHSCCLSQIYIIG